MIEVGVQPTVNSFSTVIDTASKSQDLSVRGLAVSMLPSCACRQYRSIHTGVETERF